MPRAVALTRLHVKGLDLETAVVRMGGVEVQQRTVQQGVRKRLELALKRRKLNKEKREQYFKVSIDGPKLRPFTSYASYTSL